MNIAIIGYGSIGQRHENNCLRLGHNVDVLSNHSKRKLARNNFDLVIICSKTSNRFADIKKFKNLSENFLIEKPLAANYRQALEIKKILCGKKVRVGYCLIFNPIIIQTKKLIARSVIGKVFLTHIHAGSFLPSWRKGDYKKNYSANKNESGGVELDLIHEINYAQYFFPGENSVVFRYQDKVSDLQISSSDIAFFVLKNMDRYINITLNYFQRSAERFIKLYGSDGTLIADIINKRIDIFNPSNKNVYHKIFDFDYNQMYIDEINSMEGFIKGRARKVDILSLGQAIADLKIVDFSVNK